MKKSDYIEKKKNDPPYTNKATLTVYLVLRALVIFVLVRAALRRDFESVFFCGMTLVLMILPSFLPESSMSNCPARWKSSFCCLFSRLKYWAS